MEFFIVVPQAPHYGHSGDVTISDFLNFYQTFIRNTEINGSLAMDGA